MLFLFFVILLVIRNPYLIFPIFVIARTRMFSYKLFLLPPSLILSLGAHKSTIINKPVDFFFCVLTPVNECDDGFCCVFVKIPEARHLLRRAVELISMLKKCSDTRGNDLSQVVCLQVS